MILFELYQYLSNPEEIERIQEERMIKTMNNENLMNVGLSKPL
jgi:hypothetical protein